MSDPIEPTGEIPADTSAPTPHDDVSQSQSDPGDTKTQQELDNTEDTTVDFSSESTEKDAEDSTDGSQSQTLIARYGHMRFLGEFRHRLEKIPAPGTKVVIRTERGVELGQVLVSVADEKEDTQCSSCSAHCVSTEVLKDYVKTNGGNYSIRRGGKILRVATHQDLLDQRHLDASSAEEKVFCTRLIEEMKLEMKIVFVEHLLGGERIIFYFLSEHRVDFRDLVRKLASEYRTRIEMRQVGARDEARLVGDFERCGQRCCCQQYLKDLKPVSMRMAKVQKATLDPSKISGRCGRLMCCLRYEDKTYQQLKAELPPKNIWVQTDEVIGRVVGSQIITQLVQLELIDKTRVVVPNESIVQRDVPQPKPGQGVKKIPITPPVTPSRTEVQEPIEPAEEPKEQETVLEEVELDPGWAQLFGEKVLDDDTKPTEKQPEPADSLISSASEPTTGEQETVPEEQADQQKDESEKSQKPRRRGRRRRRKRPADGGDGNRSASSQPNQASGGQKEKTGGEGTNRLKRRRRRKKTKPSNPGNTPNQ